MEKTKYLEKVISCKHRPETDVWHNITCHANMSMLIDKTILLDIPEEANTGCSAGTPVVLDIG